MSPTVRKNSPWVAVGVFALAFQAACGSAETGDEDSDALPAPAKYEQLRVVDAVVVDDVPRTTGNVRLILSDKPNVCERITDAAYLDADEIMLELAVSSAALVPGNIAVDGANASSALADARSMCPRATMPPKGIGTLTVVSGGTQVQGHVELAFGERGIRATFVARPCARAINAVQCTTNVTGAPKPTK